MELTTENGVIKYMEQDNSESDWNTRCDAVKAANDGYPHFGTRR